MQLVHEFSVQAPLSLAWKALTDIPAVASCIPGAQIDGREGDEYQGRVEVRVGPVKLGLQGAATVVSQDDDGHELVVRGFARDRNGQGTTAVTITLNAHAGDSATTGVQVTTDLELGGRVAQFGSGVVSQVSGRIIKQFVSRLNAMIDPAAGDGEAKQVAAAPPVSPAVRRGPDPVAAAAVGFAGLLLGLALGRALDARHPRPARFSRRGPSGCDRSTACGARS